MGARLIYVTGASGSGKDSLLRYARARIGNNPDIVFAHRYITRDAEAGGENHIALSAEEFAARRSSGLFALDWESHGNAYGIGIEINQWLAKEVTVVVNGSRAYLSMAKKRYPELLAISIDVSSEMLRDRLTKRGREDTSSIEARLLRHHSLQNHTHSGIVIDNNGTLADAGEKLVQLIAQCAKGVQCA